MNAVAFFGVALIMMGAFQAVGSDKWARTAGPIVKSMGLPRLEKTPAFWKKLSIRFGIVFAAVGCGLLIVAIVAIVAIVSAVAS